MFFKRKCPNCGAKNSKERMTCTVCGASLTLGQVKTGVTEGVLQAKTGLAGLKQRFQGLKEDLGLDSLLSEQQPRAYGDETIDGLCANLRIIGLDARMAEQGQPEEDVSWGFWRDRGSPKTLGLIEIRDSPIRWVNVLRFKEWLPGGFGGPSRFIRYTNAYVIPDSTIQREAHLETNREKSVPVVGQIVDLHWQGNFVDVSKGLTIYGALYKQSLARLRETIKRLNEDAQLNQSLFGIEEDVEILSYPEYKCWVIQSKQYQSKQDEHYYYKVQPAPSRELWACYETIARHLLEPVEPVESKEI